MGQPEDLNIRVGAPDGVFVVSPEADLVAVFVIDDKGADPARRLIGLVCCGIQSGKRAVTVSLPDLQRGHIAGFRERNKVSFLDRGEGGHLAEQHRDRAQFQRKENSDHDPKREMPFFLFAQ